MLASGLLFASDARRPATRVRACRTFVRMRIEGVQSSERERMKIETLYARWRAPRRFFFFFRSRGYGSVRSMRSRFLRANFEDLRRRCARQRSETGGGELVDRKGRLGLPTLGPGMRV